VGAIFLLFVLLFLVAGFDLGAMATRIRNSRDFNEAPRAFSYRLY
jgi:p-aminobenzoyl-glutamate transporter AbgT